MVIVSEMEQLMDQTNVEPVKQTYRNFHGAGWRVKKNHFITKILCFVSPELKAHVPFNNYFLFDACLLVYDFFEKKKF